MKVEFNSLHWDNVDKEMLHAHKRVMEHFKIPVNYTNLNVNHGHWLDHVMKNTSSDVVVIIEPDCIPINKDRITDYIFMCFLLGNDFMPHFPALNIRTVGIDILLNVYRETLGKTNKYLTDANRIIPMILMKDDIEIDINHCGKCKDNFMILF